MPNSFRVQWCLLFTSAILAPCEPKVSLRSNASSGIYAGVSFTEWLHTLEIEVPKPETGPFSNPLQLAGGNCSRIRITHVEATDLTAAPLSPALRVQVAANLHCVVLASGGSLAVSFYLENATADLSFSVDPIQPPGSSLAVPLGRVQVTQCSIGVALSHLRFSGSSIFESALDELQPSLQQFVNQELPSVACAQIPPLLEQQATAALASLLTQVEPLLKGHPALPPLPSPVGSVIDWSTYPPARLLRAIIENKPGVVANLIRRVPAQKVPLNDLSINRSLIVNGMGTTLRSYLEELTIQGMDSFVKGSLDVRGVGHSILSRASFNDLRFTARIRAQLQSVDPHKLKQDAPLVESFEILIGLGNVTAEADILALVSQEALEAMEVDQFQKLECLVACARGAAVGSEAPVALRRLQVPNMATPLARVVGFDSLGDDFADAMTTMLRATLHGYTPSVQQIIQSSAIILHDALNDMVQQTLESVPPCQNTQVYFGPEGVINVSLLLASFLLALFGILAGSYVQVRGNGGPIAPSSSLAASPAIPPPLSVAYPFLVAATMILFLYSDLGLGTVVNIVFQAGSQKTTIGPAFSFSVLTLSRDSLRGGAWLLAVLIVGLSGVWPFVKLGLLLFVWLAPSSSLRPSRRSRLLLFLDEYGKYSLVDSWLAILALCAFDIKWFGQDVSLQVLPVPMLPFFTFVTASVLSLVLGHVATEWNRRSLEDSSSEFSRKRSQYAVRQMLCRELPRGRSALLLALTVFTGFAVACAASLVSLQYQVSGAIADLLLDDEEKDLKYTLISLGTFLTAGFQESGGLRAVQSIFFVFTLVIPLLLTCFLLGLLLLPLEQHEQFLLFKICRVLDAWAAFDVFVLAVTVANFEFYLFSSFLIYHDNIAATCVWVRDNLEVDCLAMDCHVQPGFAVLAIAGIASYGVPKVIFSSCEGVIQEVSVPSDSEDEGSELL